MRFSPGIDANRRTVLRSLGGLSTIGAVGLAGCTGDGNGDGNGGDTIPGSDYPAVDEWLTTTEAGDADDSYDGNIVDRRDADSVTVDVGAEGNGDGYAFGPSAVAVSSGTEVLWDWTGDGGQHNVDAEPAEQIGETDFEFTSGDPVSGEDNEHTETFDDSGLALYHCEPHLSLGMKGAVVVE